MPVAIFGCGQLAQMTAQAGIKLGLTFSFIADEGEDTRCVAGLGKIVTHTPDMSAAELFAALNKPQVVTVEKETVNTQLLRQLQALTRVYPHSRIIHITQNRIREKRYLRDNGIATAQFEIIHHGDQLTGLPERLGLPIYIKAAESGYDGYHQWRIDNREDLAQPALLDTFNQGVALIAERSVNYLRELSVIAARNDKGESVVYPIMENRHEDGVLLVTVAPAAKLNPAVESAALKTIERLLSALDYVGVLTMECFETDHGLVVNELAPRVHNSGHWTIEGSATSQFDNHCRAICGMALGLTTAQAKAGLVNMLGKHGDERELASDKVFYHAYGKRERPRRKLGHVTVCGDGYDELLSSLNRVLHHLYGDDYLPLSG